MELRELIFRLAGISSICLAAMLAPVTVVERVMMLTAFSLGVGLASVLPGFDRAAARIVGPAVLLLAIGPATPAWMIVDIAALAIVGFASFDHGGMSRAVPALGLPLTTLAFRTGESTSGLLLTLWLVAVVATLVFGNRVIALDSDSWLGMDPATGPGRDRADEGQPPLRARLNRHLLHRATQTVGAAALAVPLALFAAAITEQYFPDLGPSRPRIGVADGAALAVHPGLKGGLDTGEPVALSDEEVLRVRSDRPYYWRGLAYDEWDGRRWSRSGDSAAIHWTEDGVSLPTIDDAWSADTAPATAATPGDSAGATGGGERFAPPEAEVVRQEFQVSRAGLDVVLGAWRPVALWSTARSGRLGSDGSVSLDQSLLAGASWTVESLVVPATADDLRHADPLVVAPGAGPVARYGSEDHVSDEVAALARDITADAPTTYDKIVAIEEWMEEEISYTRDIDRLPEGMDAVDHLLLGSTRGYCEQIGSALVVMLRSLGIPARLVVGYVPSSYDAATSEWVSLGTDAHAWAEVWFPGIGWQGFDPTAGVPLADEDSAGGLSIPVVPMGASAIVGVGALGGAKVFRRAIRRLRPTAEVRDRQMLEQLWADLDRCAKLLSLRWVPSSTVRERGESLIEAGVDRDAVDLAVIEFERLCYAGPPGDGQTSGLERAGDAMRALREATRRAAAQGPSVGAGAGAGAGAVRAEPADQSSPD